MANGEISNEKALQKVVGQSERIAHVYNKRRGSSYVTHSYHGAFEHFEPIPEIATTASGEMVVSSLGPTLNIHT